ncbi:MAG: type II secretion system F family protein [Gilliamella sp.]|uniref:type II secretion system F family protein n=1 Tax=Gilliamella sp. TaxID=1891236 RepID=UPI0025D55AB8|nr:type II secretion system F family protein [Gilliamella sp.]MCO6538302.1 type II secretion system F family protein [Gilliamella sp.]MCO6540483.1 type II secretion system F family protein [Gilliamella sp.]
MILLLSIVLISIAAINIFTLHRRSGRLQVFYNVEAKNTSLSSLVERQLSQRQQSSWERFSFNFRMKIRAYYNLLTMGQSKSRLFVYIFAGTVAGIILNEKYINYNGYVATLVSIITTIVVIIFIKKRKLKKEFYDTFPEALNTITGVVSSGGAITTSFKTCGNSIDGIVGKVMKDVDSRIEIGENIEDVLIRSYLRLPFPEYYFFILTVMVNLDSGGELKEVLSRLTKMLVNNRILTKTRDGKTAELRMTMKILGCMPFAFVFILKFASPANYEQLVGTTVGHYVLYYIFGSVAIGLIIIRGMISKVI